jgi:signal transduction histidine kinase
MGERVGVYGGELQAGPLAHGGFGVTARIPFDGFDPPGQVPMSSTSSSIGAVAAAGGLPWPWLDPLLATALLIVFEVAVATSSHRHGPILLNVIAVGAMALAVLWRRRSPLLFLIVFGTAAVVMNKYLTALTSSTLTGPAILLLPTYAVAAWAGRRKAVLGLAIFVGCAGIVELIGQHGTVGDFAGAALPITAAWASGRAVRSRRTLTSELDRTSAHLAAEREDRARLAVTGERTRISRELHAVVAHGVAAMVVQAAAARSLLERDSGRSDIAMAAIEDTGRDVLVEMRRILGALRHDGDNCELEPQPGVDQIFTLVQRARESGQSVHLTIDGIPGTLAPRVDLGIYRILEEALRSVRQPPAVAVRVVLQFGEHDLELRLTGRCDGPSRWPTEAMRERLTFCSGELHPGQQDNEDWQFAARIPRGLQGAPA